MKKFAAIVATAGLLVAGGAATASAETMHRNGANKVTITADLNKKVPAGATVTKARITVKKGKKVVAKNRASYTAKKGKYKVTSTVWFTLPVTTETYVPGTDTYVPGVTTTTPATTKNITADDLWLGTCTVTSRAIVQDNSTYKGTYDKWLSGDVWVDYTANCPASYYDDNYNTQRTNVDVKWQESDFVFVENITGDKATDLAANEDFYYVGQFTDSVYNFSLLTPLTHTTPGVTTTSPGQWVTTSGYWTTVPGTESHKIKTTRTVVVR